MRKLVVRSESLAETAGHGVFPHDATSGHGASLELEDIIALIERAIRDGLFQQRLGIFEYDLLLSQVSALHAHAVSDSPDGQLTSIFQNPC